MPVRKKDLDSELLESLTGSKLQWRLMQTALTLTLTKSYFVTALCSNKVGFSQG